jgi:hypothetical protein
MTPGVWDGVVATAAAAVVAAITTWRATAPPDRRKRPVAEIVSRGFAALVVILGVYLFVQLAILWKRDAAGVPSATYENSVPWG